MYGKNFNPYGKFPAKSNQLYEEEYADDKSEALEEEIDQSYEPTDKEVREYAIQTLGMSLPEDQGLLYLARDGLKAPLPPNWVPYQSRAGDVYYKHKITQQKTLEHPTDIEYRKKYEQMKQKAARKNLKSMNMKGSANLGMSASAVPTSMYGSKLNNSGMFTANDSAPIIKLDPKIEQQYEEQYRKLEQKLRRQWIQFEEQELNKHETKMKRIKLEHEADIEKIYSNSSLVKIEDKIKQDKLKIKRRIEDEQQDIFRDQIKEFSKDLELKNIEFANVYEEDNHLKLNKYQDEKTRQYEQKQKKYEDTLKKHEEAVDKKKKDKQAALAKIKQDFENGKNKEIEEATTQALQKELSGIKQSYDNQIKEKTSQLEREFNETKRILGYDQSSYLAELAAKKARLKSISQQKICSIKKKQTQAIQIKYDQQLDAAINNLKESLQGICSKQLSQERNKQENKIIKQKLKIDKQIQRESENKLQNIYDEYKLKIKVYEAEMNKKISEVQQKIINDICSKSKGENKEITQRLQLKEKQNLIDNKNNTIASLKRQVQLERMTFQLLKFQNQITKCKDIAEIDDLLIIKAKKFDLEYRTEQFLKYEQRYKQLCKKYRKDKQFLSSVMNSLQNNNSMNKSSNSNIVKQYNQDVRLMRKNQQTLTRIEQLLKKAQINDSKALEELNEEEYHYHEPQIKKQMGRMSQSTSPIYIQQFNEQIQPPKRQTFSGTRNLQSALKDQARFLTTMRSELNRKLYQIRNSTYY